ncbi:Inner membrane protein YbjJ [Paraburkholderia graminis C4D1M]|uniref:Major facilitator superfamily MFS_1 n=1 Tax=Paraburkholderia graminis (strain ATCC 700544 / DSM 17151 / LMG 18924 / NCIMB 13744 / C4D1M) TaxID=396598 RepID=B1G3H1_PARG4|nr:MFS transporter [Paraburkholderia graminis]EDT09186.1 major facilitator superfamily MFS_1 [Paraburkholderia graminis C4D1M]CAB3728845.1 Inner membrane protein YbjJ [Paraburkholderia graminis C4D1M]
MSDRSTDFAAIPAAHRNLSDTARQRARIATMALFFIAGMVYGSWGVHVPTVRDRFQLSPALLSVALLAVAGGSIGAMAANASWIARVGTRRACLTGGLVMSVCVALILVVPFYWMLLAVLALFGAGMATLDVAMNAEASAVEKALRKPIMSSLHGMFSVGGMVGAAVGGALLAHGMAPAVHLGLAAAVSALVLIAACPSVLPHVPHDEHPDSATPRANRWRSPALWALGTVALVALIAEGAMYDWATVYMRDVVLSSPAAASAAYAAFSGGMAAARFAGDAVRARFGAPQLVMASATLALAGMIGALLVPTPVAALTGFTLMGLGLANMMPVLFAAAASVKGIHAAEGLAHVAGLAYFGMLFGPVLIGAVAQVTNLSIGLSVVAVCCALIAITGPKVLQRLKI